METPSLAARRQAAWSSASLDVRLRAARSGRPRLWPLSAAEFYSGLSQRFIERDGMYFLPEQAAEYDQKRMGVQGLGQTDLFLNVINEETANNAPR